MEKKRLPLCVCKAGQKASISLTTVCFFYFKYKHRLLDLYDLPNFIYQFLHWQLWQRWRV